MSAGLVRLIVNATGANRGQNNRGFAVGALVYSLAAPVVHFAHGRVGAGFGSAYPEKRAA